MSSLKKHYRVLRLILGDQLNASHSWFDEKDADVLYLIAELRQETDYVRHHVQKICAFFAAMGEFASRLEADGHSVLHLTLDDTAEFADLPKLLGKLCAGYSISRFEYQAPDEYRLWQQLAEIDLPDKVSVEVFDSEHFLLHRDELEDCVERGKHNRMETFYRAMRRRFGYLMNGDEPAGGQWNYDQENRNRLKDADLDEIPGPMTFNNDVSAILERLDRHGVESFGDASASWKRPNRGRQLRQK